MANEVILAARRCVEAVGLKCARKLLARQEMTFKSATARRIIVSLDCKQLEALVAPI